MLASPVKGYRETCECQDLSVNKVHNLHMAGIFKIWFWQIIQRTVG